MYYLLIVSPTTGLTGLQMSIKVAFLRDLIPQFAVDGQCLCLFKS